MSAVWYVSTTQRTSFQEQVHERTIWCTTCSRNFSPGMLIFIPPIFHCLSSLNITNQPVILITMNGWQRCLATATFSMCMSLRTSKRNSLVCYILPWRGVELRGGSNWHREMTKTNIFAISKCFPLPQAFRSNSSFWWWCCHRHSLIQQKCYGFMFKFIF